MGSTFCGWESHQQSGRSTLSVTRPCWASSTPLCALLMPFQDANDCEDSPHGCCSDGVTAASGPSGQGCPTSSTLISECLSVSLSVFPSVCPFQCLSVCVVVGLFGCRVVWLLLPWTLVVRLTCASVVSPWLFLCVCLFVRLSDRLYVCIFLSVFVPPQLIARPEVMWLCIHCFIFLFSGLI